MPDDNRYQDFFRAAIVAALAHARAARRLTHQGVKGEIIEILLRDLFRPLLPADVGVGSGQIVEYYSGRLSRQQDVIIYDKSILPPILYENTKGLIPIESALYTIEVKTTLTYDGLKTAHESAKELNSFSYLPGQRDSKGREKNHPVEKARSVVFALDSDLSKDGITEVERYRSIYKNEYPFIRAICVANKEYWWENFGSWVKISGSEDNDETLGFIGGVSNTYKWVAQTRGLPNLGNYIIKKTDEFTSFPSGTQPTVNLKCNRCGSSAVLSFTSPMPQSNQYPDGFRSDDKCKCGGDFTAPPGRYELKDGLLALASDDGKNGR